MAERKMIRFDDDEEQVEQLDAELPEDQQVRPHSCEEHVVVQSSGFNYQKCGGGRRRLAKRSN